MDKIARKAFCRRAILSYHYFLRKSKKNDNITKEDRKNGKNTKKKYKIKNEKKIGEVSK